MQAEHKHAQTLPPVVDVAICVKLAALVIITVGDLMRNDSPNATEVDGGEDLPEQRGQPVQLYACQPAGPKGGPSIQKWKDRMGGATFTGNRRQNEATHHISGACVSTLRPGSETAGVREGGGGAELGRGLY